MKQVVILAGGLATRMLPLTADIPKVLLPVAGRPFLGHLFDRLAACGFTDGLLLTGHLGEAVDAYLEANPPAIAVSTVRDGEKLLGTAGALKCAEDRLGDTFVVTYGDSYLPFDYVEPLTLLDRDPSALGCMAVYANGDRFEPSNVRMKGTHVEAYDKARPPTQSFDHIDYGATALRREVVRDLPPGVALDLAPVLARLAMEGRLLGCVAPDRFYEIGSRAGLLDLESHLKGTAA